MARFGAGQLERVCDFVTGRSGVCVPRTRIKYLRGTETTDLLGESRVKDTEKGAEILNGFLHDFVFFPNPPPERGFNSSSFRP